MDVAANEVMDICVVGPPFHRPNLSSWLLRQKDKAAGALLA